MMGSVEEFAKNVPNIGYHQLVLGRFKEHGAKVAIIDGLTREEYTYADLSKLVVRLANGLSVYGLKKGDTLALCSTNNKEFICLTLAAFALGATVTLVNCLYTKDEIKRQLRDSESTIIITDEAQTEKVISAAQEEENVRIIVIGKHDHLDTTESVMSLSDQSSLPQVDMDPREQVALLVYSSGTTGLPKGVMLTHFNMVANCIQFWALYTGLSKKDRDSDPEAQSKFSLVYLPLFHMMGFTVAFLTIMSGSSAIVLLARFLPEPFLQCIQDFKISSISLVPPVALFLAKHPLVEKYDLSSLKSIGNGGAPLKKETEDMLKEKYKNVTIIQGYGMTELTTIATAQIHVKIKAGSVGKLIPGTEMKIVDPETQTERPTGEPGEIWIKGLQVMKGYKNLPEATAETIDEHGWLHTGDVGYIDEDGYIFIVDRIKELIKYKAYQVAPAELEAILVNHPAVDDAGVIGILDTDAVNELPRAFIVKKEGAVVHEDDITKYIEERVAPFKKLRGGVQFIADVPRTPTGKIMRKQLRAIYTKQ